MANRPGDRVGIRNGRSWHIVGKWRTTAEWQPSPLRAGYDTVCGKRADFNWRPGCRNRNPGVCPKCVKDAGD